MRWLLAKLLYLPILGISLFAVVYFYNAIVMGQGITPHLGVFLVMFVALNVLAWLQHWLLKPRKKRAKPNKGSPKPAPLPVAEELPQSPATTPERHFAMPPMATTERPTVTVGRSTISPRLRRFVLDGEQEISDRSLTNETPS